MHLETVSHQSRNLSTASKKLTLQALDRMEMNENDVIKASIRALDRPAIV
jgi:hypothetical protein